MKHKNNQDKGSVEFSYITLADGKKVSGTIAAPFREAAIAALRQQNIKPLSVREVKAKKSLLNISIGKAKVKKRDLVIFTRELSTMVSAGVPLPRALGTLSDQSENKYFQEVIIGINHEVEGGAPLADAMAKYPNVFSDVYVNMVRAGEAGGILDDILKRLATQVEKDETIRKKIHAAMAYPIVILTITIIAFFGIMIFILPKIAKIIKDLAGPNAQLPVYTRVLMSISNFMQHNFIFIFIILALAIWGFQHYISTPKGLYAWHGFLLRTPIIGPVIAKIVVARFSRTFASLMGSGVSILEALEVTGKAVGNRVVQKELADIAINVKNGQPLGKQLMEAKFFPPIVGQMMAVGEETGKIDQVLVKVADFYEEEVDAVIDGLAAVIEPIMIIILGAIVGVIAASVMGPIANLSKQING
ncbi:MAG: type II secretion system F family protein [Candidatus Saccharimonadales bacterium]